MSPPLPRDGGLTWELAVLTCILCDDIVGDLRLSVKLHHAF